MHGNLHEENDLNTELFIGIHVDQFYFKQLLGIQDL